jgi:hypothetical protein
VAEEVAEDEALAGIIKKDLLRPLKAAPFDAA